MIEVDVGGTIVEFPDNTPQDVMRSALQKKFGASQEQPMEDARAKLAEGLNAGERGDNATYRAAAFRTNQGVPKATAADVIANAATLGFGDEASAAATAPIDMAQRGEGFSEAYNHNLAANRDRLAQYRKENPGSALAADVAGAVVGAPVKAVGTAKLIAQGAGIGGISGAGNSEGDLIDRGKDAATGAVVGGGVGAAIPVVSKVVGAVAAPFTRNVSAFTNPEGRAVNALGTDLARDGVAPAQARQALSEAAAEGKPMTIADVGGRNTMGLARAVVTGKSAGAEKLNAMFEARRLDAPDRIVSDLRTALKDPDAFAPTLEGIIAKRQQVAAPLYEAAYSKPMPDTPVVRSILSTPAGQSAVKNAQRLSENEGVPFAADVRGLDLIKRSLDDQIGAAQRGGQMNEARVLTDMKNKLVREVDRRVPEYRAAREAYSSAKDLEDALVRGRELMKAEPEAAVAEIKAMSPTEKEVARLGMARELKSMFDNTTQTLSRVNQVLNSPRLKPIFESMFPGDAWSKFRANLTREAVMLRRGQQATGGSPTANKLADQEDMGALNTAMDIVRNPVAGALRATVDIGQRVAKGVTEKTANRLGDIFTTVDPAKQRQILDQIEKMLPPGSVQRLLTGIGGREAPTIQRALP